MTRLPSLVVLATLLLAALLQPVSAQMSFPELYEVTGVAADDTLNVRAEPSASATRIGTLAPDANGVEVIRVQNGWGLVNIGEQSGWASMRFMAKQSDSVSVTPASCFGTEPFWTLGFGKGDDLTWSTPSDAQAGRITARMTSANVRGVIGVEYTLNRSRGQAVMRPEICSDGMSDRSFGIAVDLSIVAGDSAQLYSGCCTMAR